MYSVEYLTYYIVKEGIVYDNLNDDGSINWDYVSADLHIALGNENLDDIEVEEEAFDRVLEYYMNEGGIDV